MECTVVYNTGYTNRCIFSSDTIQAVSIKKDLSATVYSCSNNSDTVFVQKREGGVVFLLSIRATIRPNCIRRTAPRSQFVRQRKRMKQNNPEWMSIMEHISLKQWWLLIFTCDPDQTVLKCSLVCEHQDKNY